MNAHWHYLLFEMARFQSKPKRGEQVMITVAGLRSRHWGEASA